MEDNSATNILLMNKENCALKLVDEIILYYDALTIVVCLMSLVECCEAGNTVLGYEVARWPLS